MMFLYLWNLCNELVVLELYFFLSVSILCFLRMLNKVSLPILKSAFVNSLLSDLVSFLTPSLGRDLRLFLTMATTLFSISER